MSHHQESTIKTWVIDTLSHLMDAQSENVYLAIVPHPKYWTDKDDIEVIKIA